MSRSASLADTKYRHSIEPGGGVGVGVGVADVEADQTVERPARDLREPQSSFRPAASGVAMATKGDSVKRSRFSLDIEV
jgi:hypothetical protein